jgi:nucleotide-binding universal stress UspA family protein
MRPLVRAGGLGGLFLGSETQRALAHSTIPVLVIR